MTDTVDRASQLLDAYAKALQRFESGLPLGWQAASHANRHFTWRVMSPKDLELPTQGWKLHVSASLVEAVDLVETVLPVLTEFELTFKVPATLDGVLRINTEQAGGTQIGKVLTVYPSADEVLRALVERLDATWLPTDPPSIPSDLPVGSSGALWIRYGAFTAESSLDALGRPQSMLIGPDGQTYADVRGTSSTQPDWAPAAPVAIATRPDDTRVGAVMEIGGQRFLPMRTLSVTRRGRLLLAMRHPDCTLAVVRVAFPGVDYDSSGSDSVIRLHGEYEALTMLRGARIGPELLAYDPVINALAFQDLGASQFAQLDPRIQLSRLHEVARLVSRLHERGLVHRDLKLLNVMDGPAGLRLIDFETAAAIGVQDPPGAGTNGYVAPEGRYATAETSYDVYSLGACLAHIELGYPPGSVLSDDGPGRLVALMKLRGKNTAAHIVAQLAHPLAIRRPSAERAADLLEERTPAMLAEHDANRRTGDSVKDSQWVMQAAVGAGLASRSFKADHPDGHYWRNSHWLADLPCEGINLGAAGIIIGLASVDAAHGRTDFDGDIAGAASWLAGRPGSPQAHGLFTGNSGVALALAVAGRRLGRDDFLVAARRRMELAATHSLADYDLFSGSAGIVLAGSLLQAITGESWPLDLVHDQAERTKNAASSEDGLVTWPTSELFDRSRRTYLGAAHGAAGTALALTVHGRAVGDQELLAIGEQCLSAIATNGMTKDRGNILATTTGVVLAPSTWCHGVAGFLWCLIQAFPDAGDLADPKRSAVNALAGAAPGWATPTLCHGTAGALEVWRMVHGHGPASVEGLAAQRELEAVAALRILQQRRDGNSVWSSEDPREITPDLWVGFLGPAASLAVHTAGSADALISAGWLTTCASRSRATSVGVPSRATTLQASGSHPPR